MSADTAPVPAFVPRHCEGSGDARLSEATSDMQGAAGAGPHGLFFWSAILLILLVSILLRRDATPDVSWLITMCERILNGEKAYIEIFETTPPVPMLLYMPGVVLAQLTGIKPETATFALAYMSALVSLLLSARILPHFVAHRGPSQWLVLLPAAVVLFALPNDAFAQREYFAAAFALPMCSVFVHHAQENAWPPLTDRIFAAILGGLTIAIKPPLFALPGIVVAIYYGFRTRSVLFVVSSGLLAAVVIGLAITVASLAAFPEYLGEIMTVMRDIYVPVRSTPLAFLNDKACLGVLLCLVLALILSVRQRPPVTAVLALVTATGFLVTYFLQGKFFPYHVFPAALFGAIAAWILIYRRFLSFVGSLSATLAGATGVYALAVFGISILFIVGFDDERPTMSDLSWAAGLDHPRALAVSPDLSTAFPLARHIRAVWVDRVHSQWVARYTLFALRFGRFTELEKTKFLRYHKQDLDRILRQIEEKRPDIIIQDVSPGSSWLTSELVALKPKFLEGYEVIAEEGAIRVLGRISPTIPKLPSLPGPDVAPQTGVQPR
jgi:hypothetical protein